MSFVRFLIAFSLIATCTLAATIYVPDDYPTIQGAIDGSANGDTVLVRAGTYVETITFGGKAITVRGIYGPSLTTIDGNQADSVVSFYNGEGPDSVIEGFSITNGKRVGGSGGGIVCYGCTPTISKNHIFGNVADFHGGGIACQGNAAPIIKRNVISANSTLTYDGAGISCQLSSPVIVENKIRGNVAARVGGGIHCYYSEAYLVDNVVAGNSAESGGGVCIEHADPTVTRNTIKENVSTLAGGGIRCDDYASPMIVNNFVLHNESLTGTGGGVFCGNHCTLDFTSNTVVANTAAGGGGGLAVYYYADVNVANSIFWDNVAVDGPELWVGDSTHPATLAISYSDVDGAQNSLHVESGCSSNWGAGMVNVDPDFIEPIYGDYHICWNSPLRDVGDNSAAGLPQTDCDGNPRVALTTTDIGADEYYYALYCVEDPIPGQLLKLKIIGYPNAPAAIALGTGVLDPPVTTKHGDLYLPTPFANFWNYGKIGARGFWYLAYSIHPSHYQGEEFPFQALVGPWGGAWTRLTNLKMLVVE